MLESVSGWSGPSLALRRASVCFAERQGVGVAAEGVVAVGQVVHARERVGVVGAELGLLQGQRLLVERAGPSAWRPRA